MLLNQIHSLKWNLEMQSKKSKLKSLNLWKELLEKKKDLKPI